MTETLRWAGTMQPNAPTLSQLAAVLSEREPSGSRNRQDPLGPRSTTAVLLLSIVAAACGSSGPAAAPASTAPAPPEATEPATTTTAAPIDEPTDDGAVSAGQIEGRWYPVAVDGVALDTTQVDYWTFKGTDTALEIGGFDGCNGFGTIGEPDPASASSPARTPKTAHR